MHDFMKNTIYLLLILFIATACNSAKKQYVRTLENERIAKDSSFLDIGKSPLNQIQIERFKGLEYFPINLEYRVLAQLEPNESVEVVKMRTSTDRLPDYRNYGRIRFTLHGKEHQLTAFQNLNLSTDSSLKDLLFVPFTDHNSNTLTYGGGRYLDIPLPKSDTFELDFNRAYNPYCAYNHRWSCVIPPIQNALNVVIDAGEKSFSDIQ
jgi:uncharacterized protein (DUF1684 family)